MMMSHNIRLGKGSCGLRQEEVVVVAPWGMMLGRIGGFEGCRFVRAGVGDRIGPYYYYGGGGK